MGARERMQRNQLTLTEQQERAIVDAGRLAAQLYSESEQLLLTLRKMYLVLDNGGGCNLLSDDIRTVRRHIDDARSRVRVAQLDIDILGSVK